MKRYAASLFLSLALLASNGAFGANSVTVESITVMSGANDVEVGIYVTNDFVLSGLVVPLEIRSLSSSAFIADTIALESRGRISIANASQVFGLVSYYAETIPTLGCDNRSGAFFGVGSDTLSPSLFQSPSAVIFGNTWYSGAAVGLPAGDDGLPPSGTPSLSLSFNVGSDTGVFIIDTTCIAPANHLLFAGVLLTQIVTPEFTAGTVTVIPCPYECDCLGDPICDGVTNVLDILQGVNVAYRGQADVVDPNAQCPKVTTDVNCDGVTDVLDVVRLINVAFRGGNPAVVFCSPCQ